MNFNEKLIEFRKQKGLSQDEFGEKIGVSRQTVSKWELAQSYPDFQKLVLISDYYGITLDELVKDVSVQDVRDKTVVDEQISYLYNGAKKTKETFFTAIKWGIGLYLTAITVIGLIIFAVNYEALIDLIF